MDRYSFLVRLLHSLHLAAYPGATSAPRGQSLLRSQARCAFLSTFPPRPPGYVLGRAITRPLTSAVTPATFERSDPLQRPNRPIIGGTGREVNMEGPAHAGPWVARVERNSARVEPHTWRSAQ
jgi:hypothetical protein